MKVSVRWDGDDLIIEASAPDQEKREFVLRYVDKDYGDKLIAAIEGVEVNNG